MKIPDRVRRLAGVILFSFPLAFPAAALADGGTLRLSEQTGNYQIAIFTSPTPLRAGPVDISVLVQDAATRELVSDVRIVIKAVRPDRQGTSIRRPATFEAATNKLFQAASLSLSEPGRWQVEIDLDGTQGKTQVTVDVEAEKPLPRYLAMWPWLAWPALPILLFATHQCLISRPARH